MLNRTRVWLNCLNLDRSTGSQYGKPPIISPRDYIANHSDDWWKSSPYNMKNFDIYLCAYSAELKVMAAFVAKIYSNPDHPSGLNKVPNFITYVNVGLTKKHPFSFRMSTSKPSLLRRMMSFWLSVINGSLSLGITPISTTFKIVSEQALFD